MASIGEVVAALRLADDRLPFAALADALELVQDARAFLELALQGTGQDEFHQVIARFDEVIDGIGELQEKLTAVQRLLVGAVGRVEGLGSSDQPRGPTSPVSVAARPATTGATSPQGLLARLPTRTKADPKTRGFWLDDQGKEREPIVSGRDELAGRAAEELRRLGIGPARGSLMTADHVEVKLAVHLRGTDQRHVTLAINNDPCRVGVFSCDQLLPRILREGQAITVYWPGGEKTYQGGTA